jgi:GTP cyclohydrolase I
MNHHRTSKEKVFGIAPHGYPLEKSHFLHSPHHPVHPHKRSALPKSYEEEVEHTVEVNTEKVEKYIEKAEYNIIKAINKTLCKAIKLAGENPSQETIQKLILKVEKAIKYIVGRNLKKAIIHIIEIDGVEEPSKHEIHNHILEAIHKIVKSADKIFEKIIEALGEDPTEEEVKLALKKVEKLLAKIVDKTVRKTLISLFELEEETEEEWYHEKEKRADEPKAAEVEAKDADVESKDAEVESKATKTTGKQERHAAAPIYSRPRKSLQCGKRSRVYGRSDHLKIEKAIEGAVESDAAKLVGNTDKKPRSIRQSKRAKRDGRFYNGYVPECKGKTIKAYGVDGQNSRALKELAATTHPNTCHLLSGDYLKYTHHELKNTVYGKLSEAGGVGQKYGNYFIEIVKNPHGYHDDIVISLDVNDKHKYDATEAKVFVGCDGSHEHPGKENICVEKTYPYLAVAEKGLNEFVFAIPDKYMCHGGHYNIAIVVDICDSKE